MLWDLWSFFILKLRDVLRNDISRDDEPLEKRISKSGSPSRYGIYYISPIHYSLSALHKRNS
jgi:hypothetical protein